MDRIVELQHAVKLVTDSEIISFDLFDTLLKRQFLAVNEVHDTVSAYALSLLGRFGVDQPGQLTLARHTTTDFLKASPHKQIQEPSLELIWQTIFAGHVEDERQRNVLVEQVVEFEIAIEKENIVLVPGVVDALEALRNSGKTIIAISDMYVSGVVIESLLAKLGILHLFSKVYVSCDVNKTKQTGDLFLHVCKDLGISTFDLTHIGDNLHSDIAMGKKVGINTVHIDHPNNLSLDRPEYGRRADIHEEIADLIKLYLFVVLFNARSSRAEQLYFLARDGCLMNKILQDWNSHFVNRLLGDIRFKDLFLNRASTCWGAVNFEKDWLVQAVGFAFWLKHGHATAHEISDLLGIEEVPETLPSRELDSQSDTILIVDAYRDCGLQGKIKQALLSKRTLLLRYLSDSGFFDHKRIAVCDVGYSGTVLRDVNLFLLQESTRPEGIKYPLADLFLIATNKNFEHNSVLSQPLARFSDQILLPVDRLPTELTESFSWLELFFKHPTYGPTRGYVENGDRVVPNFNINEKPKVGSPWALVTEKAIAKGADIVLLWMASQHFWEPFTAPLIDRFANPDDATIDQMSHEIYETDAISGTTRSVLLVDDRASPEEIRSECKRQDYWIPGSQRASIRMRERLSRSTLKGEQARNGTERRTSSIINQTSARLLRSVTQMMRPIRNKLVPMPDISRFDPQFYRKHYPDLHVLTSTQELWRHFIRFGRAEGRFATEADMHSVLGEKFGPLPDDFNPSIYLALHEDLARAFTNETQATEHYLRHGQAEKRVYRRNFLELDEEFNHLFSKGIITLSLEERNAFVNGESIRDLVFRRYGITAGNWINYLNPAEFLALNSDWIVTSTITTDNTSQVGAHRDDTSRQHSSMSSKAECILKLFEFGLEFCPPLSLDAWFDLDFYRKHNPNVADLEAAQVYKHWLNIGSNSGRAPCEGFVLARLIGSREFPAAFDWQRYLRDQKKIGKFTADERIEALRLFLSDSDIDLSAYLKKPDEAAFLELIARYSLTHGDRDRAKFAWQAALNYGGEIGRIGHRLADLAYEEGDKRQALALYIQAINSTRPDRWSFINGARVALDDNQFSVAFDCVKRGKSIWKNMAPWRLMRDAIMQKWLDIGCANSAETIHSFSSALKRAKVNIDTIEALILEELPNHGDWHNANGPILIVTGRSLSQRMRRYSKSQTVIVFEQQSTGASEIKEALVGASTVIFHEVLLDVATLRAMMCARALKIPTVSWIGNLSQLMGIELQNLEWDDDLKLSSALFKEPDIRYMLASLFCDRVITTIAGFLPLLKYVNQARLSAVEFIAPATPLLPPYNISLSSNFLIAAINVSKRDAKVAANAILNFMKSTPTVQVLVVQNSFDKNAFIEVSNRIQEVDLFKELTQIPSILNLIDSVVVLQSANYSGFCLLAEAMALNKRVLKAIISEDRNIDASEIVDESPCEICHVFDLQDRLKTFHRETNTLSSENKDLVTRSSQASSSVVLNTSHITSATRVLPRILFANIFFPPQTIGGATRVVKDNIDYLRQLHSDEFEIAILTSDDENANVGEISIDSYEGIPVFRIATPQEVDMDWRPFNPEVGRFSHKILQQFKPDLTHIHCLQRLSVAVAEECWQNEIPYIVTLHDAWWLSDYSFLTDHEGLVQIPSKDILSQAFSHRIGLPASFARAERLRRSLQRAQRRLSVSSSFADLYHDAGFLCETAPNGVTEIKRNPHSVGIGSRVQLCHVGGLEAHKGAHLIEIALRKYEFRNLALTIFELGRDAGDDTHTKWGTTPVTITGRIPADSMAEFYSRMHVLLAPSIWPESYGLVSREALLAGLWVIASDRGAMGDAIVEGQNGFKIDVSDISGLVQALNAIDDNPEKFQISPQCEVKLESPADQGEQLVRIYRELLKAHASS